MPITIALLASAAVGVANTGMGIYNNSKANRIAKELENTRPTYNISQNYYNNLSLAESRAQQGYSSETLDYLLNKNERGLQASNSAIMRAGGGLNYIGSAYDNFVQQNRAIAIDDEKLRMANITSLINERKEMAREESMQWSVNIWSKWNDRALANAQLKTYANKQISSGINTLGQVGMMYGKYKGAPKITPEQTNTVNPETIGDGDFNMYQPLQPFTTVEKLPIFGQ